ncbi:MAG: hypothetical protein M0R03_14490 [Novosphingobium sp.]|nr:hypothetical protein [Novosphingobium sp.]
MNWREKLARSPLLEREYKISGSEEYLDEIERMFDFITYCCSVGHSAVFKVSVDGDGSANLKVTKVSGELENIDEERMGLDERGKELYFGFGE